MAKTIAQINAQIEKLQKQADVLKAKEAAGVIARIKVAIEHYGLTAADLGFSGLAIKPAKTAKTVKPVVTVVAKKARKKAAPKPVGVIRFRDDVGHSWTGKGTRPNWYKAAIEAGKTPESLSV
jgi:DNA-binding protein H-NS